MLSRRMRHHMMESSMTATICMEHVQLVVHSRQECSSRMERWVPAMHSSML